MMMVIMPTIIICMPDTTGLSSLMRAKKIPRVNRTASPRMSEA